MTNLSVRPLFDKIVLELKLERTTESGIIITAVQDEDRNLKGVVVARGEGKVVNGVRQPIGVNVGDLVLFDKFSIVPIKVGDQMFFIGREDGILGILEKGLDDVE